MISKLEALCTFNALFSGEKWLSASIASDTPYNNLQLWHDLNQYGKYDPTVVQAARTALE